MLCCYLIVLRVIGSPMHRSAAAPALAQGDAMKPNRGIRTVLRTRRRPALCGGAIRPSPVLPRRSPLVETPVRAGVLSSGSRAVERQDR